MNDAEARKTIIRARAGTSAANGISAFGLSGLAGTAIPCPVSAKPADVETSAGTEPRAWLESSFFAREILA